MRPPCEVYGCTLPRKEAVRVCEGHHTMYTRTRAPGTFDDWLFKQFGRPPGPLEDRIPTFYPLA